MSADAIWQAFAETGDPLYYLLYRSVQGVHENRQEKNDERLREQRPKAQT